MIHLEPDPTSNDAMNFDTTPTPQTDSCPHCGAEKNAHSIIYWKCHAQKNQRSVLCIEREARQKAEAEVEKLKAQLSMAIDLADRLFPHMASAIYYMEKNDI